MLSIRPVLSILLPLVLPDMGRPRKLTDEERKARKKALHQKWRADNPDKAKASDKRRHDRQYTEDTAKIKQRNSDWQKANRERRRQYLREWRDAKKRGREDPSIESSP